VRDRRNREVDWDQFDPDMYCRENYRSILPVDLEILRQVRDFFGAGPVTDGRGLDIGAGANLYPSLAMLPFCRSIDLREYSRRNVDWLERRIASGYDVTWDGFWDELARHPAYRGITDPRREYSARATVSQGSVFDLERHRWDIGTMFFVACLITSDITEFDSALDHFIHALKPGAPFAAAFMLGSTGYDVDGVTFPSVPLTKDDVRRGFERTACDVDVTEIETKQLIRPGYGGMALAIGRAGTT
jgi:hypothetical protein